MENNMSMEELLKEENGSELRVGDTVEGEVVSLRERVAYVDINQATEGQIYLNYFTTDKNVESFAGLLKIGQKIRAKVTKISETKNGDTIIMLSCLDMIKDEELAKLAEAITAGPVDVLAKVVKINEKSYELRYNGLRLFMSIRDSKETYEVNKELLVRIT